MVHSWSECWIGASKCFRIRQTERNEDISPGNVAGKLVPPLYTIQSHRSGKSAGADLHSVASAPVHLNAPKSGSLIVFPAAKSSKTAMYFRMKKSGPAGGFGTLTTGGATGPRI